MRNRLLLMGRKKLVPGGIWWDCTRLSPDGLTLYDSTGLYPGTLGTGASKPTADVAGLSLDGSDRVSLPGLTAAVAGKSALTVMVVARAASRVQYSGVVGSTATTNKPFILLSANDGNGGDCFSFSVYGASYGVASVPYRLGPAWECLTGRYIGAVAVEGRHNLGTWTTSTATIPASIIATPGDTATIGQYSNYYLNGGVAIVGVYPGIALTDAQIAQNYRYLRALLGPRGIKLPSESVGDPRFGLAIGDSITEASYPQHLNYLLGYRVVNAGVGGNTTAQMLARTPGLLAAYSYGFVAVLGGTNDLATVAVETTEANLAEIVADATATGARAILLTIPPSSTYDATKNGKLAAINAWIAAQASRTVLVADTHTALKDPATPTQLLAAYDFGDHVHLSAAGDLVVANTVYAALRGAGLA